MIRHAEDTGSRFRHFAMRIDDITRGPDDTARPVLNGAPTLSSKVDHFSAYFFRSESSVISLRFCALKISLTCNCRPLLFKTVNRL